MSMKELLEKYDQPVPRYTSYPTVPYWSDSPNEAEWLAALEEGLALPNATWALYLHIPFCETLCTFCGCNTTITKDHARGLPYVDHLLKEWSLYRERVPQLGKMPLRQLHLGGGTPTFLSPSELERLLSPLLESANWEPGLSEASIEVDPRRTTREQLAVLRKLGFGRVSLGVQDFDPEVQRLVNRIQPEEETRRVTDAARELGYTSVNFDLIYGLPKQTAASFARSVESTLRLRPDRIALYSLAVVPWIKPAQRLFKDEDLPAAPEKRALYESARASLMEAGYREIGMDHFALPTDGLSLAQAKGSLHRNFMGYADLRTDVLLGLGVSSISEAPGAFYQNEKVLPLWERKIAEGLIPGHRGHKLSIEDRRQRERILQFMTRGRAPLNQEEEADARLHLAPMLSDGLVTIDNGTLAITERGRPFLRNAAVFFDLRLRRAQPTQKLFSRSI
jgi:oxygen-independent coproporphyrinogen-3 oxidase